MKKYESTTAAVMAKNNEFAADVMEVGEAATRALSKVRDNLKEEYWALHNRVGSVEFEATHQQVDAIAKLGELALALQALDKAYSATSKVRCW